MSYDRKYKQTPKQILILYIYIELAGGPAIARGKK